MQTANNAVDGLLENLAGALQYPLNPRMPTTDDDNQALPSDIDYQGLLEGVPEQEKLCWQWSGRPHPRR